MMLARVGYAIRKAFASFQILFPLGGWRGASRSMVHALSSPQKALPDSLLSFGAACDMKGRLCCALATRTAPDSCASIDHFDVSAYSTGRSLNTTRLPA